MEKDDDVEFFKLCWNNFEMIHNEKVEYFSKLYTKFSNLSNYLSEFQKNYDSLEIDALLNPIVNDQFNDLIKNINKSMTMFIDLNSVMVQTFLKEFKDINNIIKEENILYEKVVAEQKKYKEKLEKMEKIKKHFYEKMENIEDSLKEKILKKNKKISIDNKKMSQAMKDFNEYKTILEDYNKIKEEFNIDQKTLLEEHYIEIFKNEIKLFEVIKKKFYTAQKSINDYSSPLIEKYKNKKESKKEKNENEIKYFNDLIAHYRSTELPEDKLNKIEYHLKHKPYVSDPQCSPGDLVQANQISDEIIKCFRKTIKENYPDSGLQIQEAYLEIPDVFKLFFTLKVQVNDELKKEMLRLLKEDFSLYRQILIMLGKLRADGKLFASKDHMKFITILILEILKIAEQKIDFKAAKDCILLSQTYYILNDKNEKIYSFEAIKHLKWLKSSKFWREFLDEYINIEFIKFEEMYHLDVKIKDNPELKGKMRNKVKDVLFSCLVPYVNNMNELEIDKRIILKILDEIIERYNYLDEESKNNIERFISNSSEEIEQIRKEYKENPNLEYEIEKMNEKEEENKNLLEEDKQKENDNKKEYEKEKENGEEKESQKNEDDDENAKNEININEGDKNEE